VGRSKFLTGKLSVNRSSQLGLSGGRGRGRKILENGESTIEKDLVWYNLMGQRTFHLEHRRGGQRKGEFQKAQDDIAIMLRSP